MGLQFSVAVRNGRLDAIEAAIGASAILKLLTGALPANVGAADSGTVVATMNLPADFMANASGGSKALSGSWSDSSADANGIAQHFRMFAADGVTPHVQGLVSEAYGNSKSYAVGQQVSNVNGVYRCSTAGTSASTGTGPSGTTGTITDGTAQFTYLQAAPDMTLDNTNISSGQSITITGFTITDGNA